MLRSIAINFASGITTRVILVVITLITTPVLLQKLGNEGYGIITLLLAILGFGGLLDLGFGQSLVRSLSSAETQNKQTHYSTAARIFLALGFAGALLLISATDAILSFISKSGNGTIQIQGSLIAIIAFSLPIKMISALFSSVLYSEEMIHADNVAQTSANIFRFTLMTTLALLETSLSVVATAIPTSILILILIQQFYLNKLSWLKVLCLRKYSKASSRELSRTASGLFMSRASGELALNADKLVITTILGIGALAPYTVAYLIISRLNDIGFLISSITFPKLVHLISTGQNKLALKLYRTSIIILLGIGLLATVAIILHGEQFLKIWLKRDYVNDIYKLLIVFMIGAVVSLPNWINGNILTALNRTKLLAVITIIPALFSVAACWEFTIRWQMIGAVWAWTLGYIFITISLFVSVYYIWIKSNLNVQ